MCNTLRLLSFSWLVLLSPVFAEDAANTTSPERIDFNTHIRPIFTTHCTACHGGVKQAGEISFVQGTSVLPPEGWIVEPGDADASILIERVTETDPDLVMPPPEHGEPLSTQEIRLLKQWINQGANWGNHWCFDVPQQATLPTVGQPEWCNSRIDHFILARLQQQNLSPAAQASRRDWLRRVSFDLTGLPPSAKLSEWFNNSSNAHDFEAVVDQLLASTAYGERWTALWLDLARYADSQGYEKDSLRTMWPYRDWLIRAHNENMPYDQLTRFQLAGDLIDDAPLDALIATGFHRNTPTNSEGGTDDEEFRITSLIDRVNTTWEVWQGLTFKCVQCHSHPYEPIDHDEYYQFMAYFNTSQDWDLRDDAPMLKVPKQQNQFEQMKQLMNQLKQLDQMRVAQTIELSQSTQWQPVTPVNATSTGLTKLDIVSTLTGPEIQTRGTVSHDSQFTIDLNMFNSMPVNALQLTVRPVNAAKALHTAEPGFVFSEVKAFWVSDSIPEDSSEKSHRIPISLKWALGDEVLPFGQAQDTLDPNNAGWGAKPKISHERHLVIIPEQPLTPPAEHHLQLVIEQKDAPNDLEQLVARRLQIAMSDESTWTELTQSVDFLDRDETIRRLRADIRSIPGDEIPVMQQQTPSLQRQTAVFQRGDWLNKQQTVEPGIPQIMQRTVENPQNRLQLANWLTSDHNPLTARVAVNRYWEQLFGQGIVPTTTDFGSSGVAPTHPQLLDDLAWRFQHELNWDIKALLKEIVLSSTYRQAAVTTPLKLELDPRNQLLSRGPHTRLTAEMIRDNALMVSGLLNDEMYGPPVMPPQPDGIWRAARSRLRWSTDVGPKRYRRAVYTIWRRSSPYPSFMAFDAPQRVICSGQRGTTNTPLQALVTLNDPVYMECAMALAETILKEHVSPALQIESLYTQVLGHPPAEQTLMILNQLHQQSLWQLTQTPEQRSKLRLYHRQYIEAYANWEEQKQKLDAKKKKALAEKAPAEQIAKLAAELPPVPQMEISAELAALTMTANVILNLDQTLTK